MGEGAGSALFQSSPGSYPRRYHRKEVARAALEHVPILAWELPQALLALDSKPKDSVNSSNPRLGVTPGVTVASVQRSRPHKMGSNPRLGVTPGVTVRRLTTTKYCGVPILAWELPQALLTLTNALSLKSSSNPRLGVTPGVTEVASVTRIAQWVPILAWELPQALHCFYG